MSGFWSLIEQARANASTDAPESPSSSEVGAALTDLLAQLPLKHIVEFDACYRRADARAHKWGMCAAAFVIWNYISDDTFSDFKGGVIGLGQAAFEQIVADPDLLADHPMVRAIAAATIDPFTLGAEAIQFAASYAYQRRTDDDADGFWEAAESYHATNPDDDEAPGERWSGGFGNADDAAQIPLRLPRLHALFASSAANHR